MIPSVGAGVLTGPQAATGRSYNTHNIRSSYAVGRDDPARRPKFAFYLSRGPDFRRRTGIFRPRARYFPWMESTQRSSGRRPHKVRCAQDAQVWASLAALPCSSSPNHDHSAAVSGSAALRMRRTPCGYYVGSWLGSRGLRPYDFPDPGRTFRPCPKFVRRGHELGAAASSARCRSCRSNQAVFLFLHCASRMPCLSDSIR